jgi:putative hydrolase of the HAD superfamily
VPKPEAGPYNAFLKRDRRPARKRAAMFEDLARNLETPHAFGMRTVLVVPPDVGDPDDPDLPDWEREGRSAAHIDHVTDDLAGFLENVLEALGAPAAPAAAR